MLSAQTNAPGVTILIVDDSPDMRRYLRVLLELDRYQVETADDGIEALRRLKEGCLPDVVLLDLQMPRLNGLRTLHRIRKHHPDLKVIICSAEEDPRKLRLAEMLGADAHVSKPVRHLYLSAAVERCLGPRPSAPPSHASVITLPSPTEAVSNDANGSTSSKNRDALHLLPCEVLKEQTPSSVQSRGTVRLSGEAATEISPRPKFGLAQEIDPHSIQETAQETALPTLAT